MPLSDALTADSVRRRLPNGATHLTDEHLESRIEDALALAEMHAPCITRAGFRSSAAAVAILRNAILYDIGADQSSDTQSETVGPFSRTRFAPTRSGTLFSPSQVEALKALCDSERSNGAGVYSLPFEPPPLPASSYIARGDSWTL